MIVIYEICIYIAKIAHVLAFNLALNTLLDCDLEWAHFVLIWHVLHYSILAFLPSNLINIFVGLSISDLFAVTLCLSL